MVSKVVHKVNDLIVAGTVIILGLRYIYVGVVQEAEVILLRYKKNYK